MKTYKIQMLKDESYTKNNVYVIIDKSRKAAIIDPACEMNDIIHLVEHEKLIITDVYLTHTHPDHIRSVEGLVSKYGCHVHVSEKESKFYSYSCRNLLTFSDEEIFYIGATRMQAIITPGHSFGSACFFCEDSIFTGDTLFMEGCGICNTHGGSAEDMYMSIQRLKSLLGGECGIYPGHTYGLLPGKTFDEIKGFNIYLSLDRQEDFIKFRMREPNTIATDYN